MTIPHYKPRGDSEGGETDIDRIFATAPELQYLAPEDYELPPADPALLASANRILIDQLTAIRDAMGDAMLSPADIPARIREMSTEIDLMRGELVAATSQRDAWREVAAGHDCDTPSELAAMLAGYRTELDSSRHECEALRKQPHGAPDLETVPLHALIEHVALFLDDGQSITVHPEDVASVQAFGKSFACSYKDANAALDATAMLARLEVQ